MLRPSYRGIPRTPRNKSRVFNAQPSQSYISKCCALLFVTFFGSIPKTIFTIVLIFFGILGNTEYQRLAKRASVFHKKWNPIAETFDEFFESEKKTAKNSLFAQWHGANTFYDMNPTTTLSSDVAGVKVQPVDSSAYSSRSIDQGITSPTLRELLRQPSRHPFYHPLDATRSHRPKTSSLVMEPPKQRHIGDVTLILNHYKRNTLVEQLNAVLTSSVLPKEVWVCLFSCEYEQEALYRKQVSNFVSRYSEQGCQLHIISSDFNFKYFGRFQLALQAPTGYVWVVDDDVVPGARFLEVLLHVAGTSMTFGALGATGWLMPSVASSSQDVNQGTETLIDYRDPSIKGGLYIPDDRYNLTVTRLTETDVLCSQWFLRTPLVALLFRERPPSFETGEDFLLSYALRKFASLPSYVLPCALHNKETWGNVDLSAHTASSIVVTPALRASSSSSSSSSSLASTTMDMVAKRNELWGKLLARGAVPIRTILRDSPGAERRRSSFIDSIEKGTTSNSESSNLYVDDYALNHRHHALLLDQKDDDLKGEGVNSGLVGEKCSVLMAVSSLEDASELQEAYAALDNIDCTIFLVLAVDHPHKDFRASDINDDDSQQPSSEASSSTGAPGIQSSSDTSKFGKSAQPNPGGGPSILSPMNSAAAALSRKGPPSVLRLRSGSGSYGEGSVGDDFADDDEVNDQSNDRKHVAFSSSSFGGSLGLGVSGLGGGGGLERAAYHLAATWANNEMTKKKEKKVMKKHMNSQLSNGGVDGLPLTCSDLLTILKASRLRCSADRFGTFRVRKPRHRTHSSPSLTSARANVVADALTTEKTDSVESQDKTNIIPPSGISFQTKASFGSSFSLDQGQSSKISPPLRGWASGGFTGFGDALGTTFSITSKLKPNALVWWSPNNQKSEPLVEAFELVSEHFTQIATSPSFSTGASSSENQFSPINGRIDSCLKSLSNTDINIPESLDKHSKLTRSSKGELVVKYLGKRKI